MSDSQFALNSFHQGQSRERLRQRQKRRTTSCWPCRDRKVKCNKSQPCDTCNKRGYPDLCSYGPPSGHNIAETGAPQVTPHPPHSSPHVSRQFPTTRTTLTPSSRAHSEILPGSGDNSPSTSAPRSSIREPCLANNIIPAFVQDHDSADDASGTRNIVEVGIMPILGLNLTTASFPFLPVMADKSNIHEGLPSDRDMIKIFQCFRTQLQVFTPIISNVDLFEKELCALVDHRTNQRGQVGWCPQQTFSLAWLGLLYAVLASGVQFSDYSSDKRSSISTKFAQYSFQSLRLANFLMRPTVECLQALLVLGNVIQNMMQPEAAWILLGTTTRIAQTLGLHQQTEAGSENSSRRKLWLAVIWQDSLLSLCLDRPSAILSSTTSPVSESVLGRLSYFEAMYSLQKYLLEGMQIRAATPHDFEMMFTVITKIDQIFDRVQEHLQILENCVNFQQRSEYYAVRIHTSFVAWWLLRDAFKHNLIPESQLEIRRTLAAKGKECLIRSLRAYLNLHPICIQASRSWAYIHNGLSSALVLGLLGETKVNPEVRELQGALIDILSMADDNTKHQFGTEGSVVLSKLHERALLALKSLYNDQPLRSVPAPVVYVATSNQDRPATKPYNAPSTDMPPYSNDCHYEIAGSSPQPPMDMMGMANASELSPMELFDSIIWDPNFPPESFQTLGPNSEPWIF